MKLLTRANRKFLFTLLLCGAGVLAFGLSWRASATAQSDQLGQVSPDGIWQGLGTQQAQGAGRPARAFRLNKNALVGLLSRAPKEGAVALHESAVVFTLPLPDGTFSRFSIEESSNFEPALADRFPDIKSYRGQSVDSAATTARFDFSPIGFHALVLKPEGAIEIAPASVDDTSLYFSSSAQVGNFSCEVNEWQNPNEADNLNRIASIQTANGALRRNYRIAIATTGEYYQLYGGNNTAVLASLNAWLNAINAIYEKELAVHLNLVNNTTILFPNGATDPFTNGDPNTMNDEVRAVLRDQVGPANYELGHVLGTNSGGSAYVGVICQETDNGGDGMGPMKGGGASGMDGTPGTGGSVGLWAHELGHQFGSRHNFNGTVNNCGGNNHSNTTSYEVGSGSTIMSYSGICGSDNLQNSKDLRFHAGSLIQILAHLAGTGGACAATAATGNMPPTVTSGGNFTVPKQTPFSLTSTGNDADPADVANLTYAWEQLDAGGANFPNPPYGDQPGDPANTTRPLFRAYPPTASPVRTFPSLTYILNNANVPPLDLNGFKVGEALPSIGRTLNFRVTVRDNRADNGGINDADMVLTVDGASGPFNVTAPNGGENLTGGAATNVTWNVAGTNGAPINVANVKISLSTDGGNTFPFVLAANTPNDGTQSVTFPNGVLSTTARLKIEAVGNIFFDISDANFNLTPGGGCHGVSALSVSVGNIGSALTITGVGFTGVNAVRFSNNVTATMQVVNDTTITTTVPAGAVTGPLTLVKTGCPDAPSGTFTICPNPPVVLSVDDGTSNGNLGATTGDNYYVNRLTPANYPATLNSVQIFFGNALPVGTSFSVLTGTNPTGSNDIDNSSFQASAATVQATNQFNTYSVAPLTITAGDFVVGWRINRPNPGNIAPNDGTPPIQLRSYYSSSGSSFLLLDEDSGVPTNLMIRAQIFTGNCGGGAPACPTVNNIAPTNGAVGAQVVITGTNFTGVTGVKFSNNVNATFTVDSATQITATVPAGAVTGPLTISKTGCNDVQTATFTVNANCPTITITPANLPAGTVNTAYNQALTGNGGTAPYTFALDAGNATTSRFDATGPVNIPDNNPAGIDLPVAVSGITSSLVKVTVALQITHTFGKDLKLQLIGPDATTIDLAVNRGPDAPTAGYGNACNPDASRTTFDDAAATLIANGIPPFVGSFKPDQMLAGFIGKTGAAVNGQWKLHVVDNANQDVGTINCVSLFITHTQPAPGLTLATNGTLSGTPTTAGTFNFTVKATDANSCMGTKAFALTVNAAGACPTVNNLNPTSGQIGAQVVITGTNFTGVNGVKFSNNVNATFNVDSATQITAAVPAGAVTGPLTISKTNCTEVQTATFTVTVPANCPTVTGLNPSNGGVGGQVVITGTNFTGVTGLKFSNNVTANFTVNSATQITATIPNGAVTGPLTLSKTGCADVQTASFTVCTGAAQLLQVDNNAYASSDTVLVQNPQTYFVNRLTPASYPATLSQVLLRFDFVQAGEPITIVVAPNPTGSTNINNLTFQTVNVTAPGGSAGGDPIVLDPYNVPAITINSGDFVVGFGLASNGPVNFSPMSADNNVPPAGRSYKAGSLTSFNQPVEKNYMIRARYLTGCGGGSGTGLQFYPLPAPVRLLDTRAGEIACTQPSAPIAGQTSLTQMGRGLCNIPANAVALTGNLTTVQSGGGYLTLYPSNAPQPTVASTNYNANEIINNVFTVGLGPDGAFKIFAFFTTEVVVDVTGYYAPPSTGGLYFHPLPKPIRLLETRAGEVGCNTPGAPIQGGVAGTRTQQARLTCDGVTIPNGALAIVGNATTVGPQAGGYLTLFPANAAQPLVASSNYNAGQVVNGPFSVGLAPTGEFNIFSFATTDLVVDVLGYYSTEANDVNGVGLLFNPLPKPVRLLETRANQAVGCYLPGLPLISGVENTQPARGACDGVTIPANALGVVGNATVVTPNAAGYLTLWPSTALRPLVATANYNAGDIGNRHFIVGLGAGDGAFKLFSSATTELVIDLSGYFAP
jgi:subtilisin-like proprotein convertase family protein